MLGTRLPEPIPYSHNHVTFSDLNQLGRSLSLLQKKEVMTALRVGRVPRHSRRMIRDGVLRRSRLSLVHLRDIYGNETGTITMHDVWHILDSYLQTPVRRSLLSLVLRGSPIRQDEAELAVSQGIEKEVSVTQRLDLFPSLNFPFLLPWNQAVHTTFHPDLPFRPSLIAQLCHKFLRWKTTTVPSMFLVPQAGYKSVGIETRDNFLRQLYPNTPSWELPNRIVSTADLEALYCHEGVIIEGPCEMRYAWKYNDLKPRVYYAIGGSAYNAAKYIKPFFDSICNMSRSTSPRTRYSFAGFPSIDFTTDVFLIYDYASFTSRLVEFKSFVAELALYVKGVKVKAFDTNQGVIEVDAGKLLDFYNEVCNIDGEYSLTRLSKTKDDQPTVLVHHFVAGMLGVFGNIVGCTALHGIVGIQICGTDDQGNFIGDDAGILVQVDEYFTKDSIFTGIRVLGDIADPKFEIFEDTEESFELSDAWHFTKRPIGVRDYGIYQEWMPEFPILPQARGQRLDHVTLGLPKLDIRRRIFLRQTVRFLNSLHTHRHLVEESDWDMVLTILRKIYVELRLPIYGCLPKKEYAVGTIRPYGDPHHVVPPLSYDVLERGWWTVLKEKELADSGTFFLPRFTDRDPLPAVLEAGFSFNYGGDRVLSVLEKCGVVQKVVEREERLATEETLELLDLYLTGEIRPVYTYYVLEDYPPWSSYVTLTSPL